MAINIAWQLTSNATFLKTFRDTLAGLTFSLYAPSRKGPLPFRVPFTEALQRTHPILEAYNQILDLAGIRFDVAQRFGDLVAKKGRRRSY